MTNDPIKYPRTPHLPWSHPSKNDKIIRDLSSFNEKEIVVSVKIDGENCTMYKNFIHARSLMPMTGQDRGFVKSLHATISSNIPDGWRICCENAYAKHSIHYSNLENYVFVLSIWNEENICLSWDETLEWCELLGLTMVPTIYRGVFSEEYLQSCYTEFYNGDECEGYVIRLASKFHYDDFKNSVAKFVRKEHVKPNAKHWRQDLTVPNGLSNSSKTDKT
jgi:hypothetical protein